MDLLLNVLENKKIENTFSNKPLFVKKSKTKTGALRH